MQDFRNLDVWQRARKLNRLLYEMTVDFQKSETFGLRSQMRRASVSICSNIAEGCGRRGDRDFRRCVDIAMGSACELECEVILGLDLAFVAQQVHDRIIGALVEVKRMLRGLIASLKVLPKTPAETASQSQPLRISRRSVRRRSRQLKAES